MFYATTDIAQEQRSQSADLAEWRKRAAMLREAAELRWDNYHYDFTELDRAAERLRSALDRRDVLVSLVGATRDFYDALDRLLEREESSPRGMYFLRRRAVSLRCRTLSVLREMSHHSRAPEFDELALRGILKDYDSLRD